MTGEMWNENHCHLSGALWMYKEDRFQNQQRAGSDRSDPALFRTIPESSPEAV